MDQVDEIMKLYRALAGSDQERVRRAIAAEAGGGGASATSLSPSSTLRGDRITGASRPRGSCGGEEAND